MNEKMSAEMVRAIEWDCTRLVSHYALLNDAARWVEASALFLADGRLARPSAPDAPIVGREAILAAFLARPPRVTRHVCSNIVIDVIGPDAARGESAMLLFTSTDAPPLVGGFIDRFARTAEGWRFAERRGTLSF
ncbi:nuclear transport factor 2 family protein [Sphingomonas qilianensis]|uniref:Nuclear transport factor 2 family protein n=1 Tax=Sphingomonas qilianensis TaxID=1736690 RepID=A0ABU9XUT2_9SPHN